MAYKAKFADISAYQRHDLAFFQALKAQGYQGVVVKVTEGEYWTSGVWQAQCSNAIKAGLQTGIYHFARFSSPANARTEAQVFLSKVKSFGFDKTTVAMLDCETNDYHQSAGAYQACVNAWLDTVRPVFPHVSVYASKYWWLSILNPYNVGDAIVWLAGYGITNFGGITNVGAWQWDDGKQNSLGVDTNWDYNGAFTRAIQPAGANAGNSARKPAPSKSPNTPANKPANKPANQPAAPQKLTGWTDNLGDYWYNEKGTFTLSYPIVMRWGAKLSSSRIAVLAAGSVIKYDAFSHHDGYVWLRQPRGNGNYGYLPSGKSANGKRLDYWGKFS